MKETNYIYKVVDKFSASTSVINGESKALEDALMAEHTTKELHHVIEMDTRYLIIWRF